MNFKSVCTCIMACISYYYELIFKNDATIDSSLFLFPFICVMNGINYVHYRVTVSTRANSYLYHIQVPYCQKKKKNIWNCPSSLSIYRTIAKNHLFSSRNGLIFHYFPLFFFEVVAVFVLFMHDDYMQSDDLERVILTLFNIYADIKEKKKSNVRDYWLYCQLHVLDRDNFRSGR